MRLISLFAPMVVSVAVLAACGGGGGDSGTPSSGTGTGTGGGVVATPVVAGNIVFDSAVPSWIYIKNSGAIEQTILKFKVTSVKGEPAAAATVNFSVQDDNPYGLTLLSNSAVSDADGVVQVTVKSGAIPGPVKVKAALATDAAVSSLSQGVTVSTSPPSQKFMSVASDKYAIEGQNIDGTEANITVRIADQQGNPVQDGTVVNFTTEGGQIAGSCATALTAGVSSCSVKLVSQNFRPANGRVSVLAYLEGVKEFSDLNSDNIFNGSDVLKDMGDAYRDDNENGIYDTGEFLISRGGVTTCAGTPYSSGLYYPSRANTCSGQLRTTVRQQVVIAFATSAAKVIPSIDLVTQTAVFTLSSADPYSALSMPAGTKFEVTGKDNTADNNLSCKVDLVAPIEVPVNVTTPTKHTVYFSNCETGDTLQVVVTSPSGYKTNLSFPLE
jgi:hypothetical protein